MRFLLVDRIVELLPGAWVKGIKHVTWDDAYLSTDDQDRPCFISSFIGEALGQLAAWNVMQKNEFTARPVAGVVAKASLRRPAYIGETILLESYIDSMDETAVQYHSVARVGTEEVFTIEGALGPLLPMSNFIGSDEIRQQFSEIYRPGDWQSITTANVDCLQNIEQDAKFISNHMHFDRIIHSDSGVSLIAEKKVNRAATYFPDHFPKKPVLPLTVLLECKLNLAKEFIKRADYDTEYQVLELRKIKMSDFVQPGDVVVSQITVKQKSSDELILNFRSEVEGKRVCVVDVVFIPKG
ncbi:hydroxymyristoyl-ACP dehydratase [Legionella waltersii]|uniref:(3R)-hydroxymyristoyl-ACP dehydratase n=1 Tax=Legionella waltersii TaxID=66969 RepID=A0A0W1A2T0_9GAMM|nr:hydroxymyristoyl-ACP dehydratase [Legionella waltersii]KTD75472.1 (3R)-hydroxymyristoyl-ACP dehydratase [Legionella waltersii]SNU98158.1 (3R)-hydroxymyristoyl-ACP dehydratase [Legionella waltersii]